MTEKELLHKLLNAPIIRMHEILKEHEEKESDKEKS